MSSVSATLSKTNLHPVTLTGLNTISSSNFLKHEEDINPAFDVENTRESKRSKTQSLFITILVHALLFLVFYFFIMKPPFPPLSEEGVFVNLGFAEIGSGKVQPQREATEVSEHPSPPAAAAKPQPEKNILTQQNEKDVPAIPNKPDPKQNTKNQKPDVATASAKNNSSSSTPKTVTETPKALYPGARNNSSSEGTGAVPGDMGQTAGDPQGTAYHGNPGTGNAGNGGSGNAELGLAGRKFIYLPTIIDPSQKTGRVVVNIHVDRTGNVISAKATQMGSSTTDPYLFHLAEQAALKTKINADVQAAEEQVGTITYIFSVK
jgi:periplasmic protein TonB